MSLMAPLHHVAYFKYAVRNPYQSYPVFFNYRFGISICTKYYFWFSFGVSFDRDFIESKSELIISRHCSFDSYIQLF